MDKPKATPKDFFLWAGAMFALYVAIFNYVGLVWDYINYSFPDPLAYYNIDPYQGGVSWEMASLIVLAPVFLLLMWVLHKDIEKDSTRSDIWVRRWALFLTLFVAGVAVVADLIYVLYEFLNGIDLSTRFLLKALVVLLVASVGFMHFMADLWGYWEKFPMRNRMVAAATAVLVAVTIVAGFFIVGTPGQARLYRYDSQKITDLDSIQSQIVYYWQLKQALPASLSDLTDSISGYRAPLDPQTAQPYTYRVRGKNTFTVCATFNGNSVGGENSLHAQPKVVTPPPVSFETFTEDNWQHGKGEVCFDRTIDPVRYPPINQIQ